MGTDSVDSEAVGSLASLPGDAGTGCWGSLESGAATVLEAVDRMVTCSSLLLIEKVASSSIF